MLKYSLQAIKRRIESSELSLNLECNLIDGTNFLNIYTYVSIYVFIWLVSQTEFVGLYSLCKSESCICKSNCGFARNHS